VVVASSRRRRFSVEGVGSNSGMLFWCLTFDFPSKNCLLGINGDDTLWDYVELLMD
jgi:hypothetical protein